MGHSCIHARAEGTGGADFDMRVAMHLKNLEKKVVHVLTHIATYIVDAKEIKKTSETTSSRLDLGAWLA